MTEIRKAQNPTEHTWKIKIGATVTQTKHILSYLDLDLSTPLEYYYPALMFLSPLYNRQNKMRVSIDYLNFVLLIYPNHIMPCPFHLSILWPALVSSFSLVPINSIVNKKPYFFETRWRFLICWSRQRVTCCFDNQSQLCMDLSIHRALLLSHLRLHPGSISSSTGRWHQQ